MKIWDSVYISIIFDTFLIVGKWQYSRRPLAFFTLGSFYLHQSSKTVLDFSYMTVWQNNFLICCLPMGALGKQFITKSFVVPVGVCTQWINPYSVPCTFQTHWPYGSILLMLPPKPQLNVHPNNVNHKLTCFIIYVSI